MWLGQEIVVAGLPPLSQVLVCECRQLMNIAHAAMITPPKVLIFNTMFDIKSNFKTLKFIS